MGPGGGEDVALGVCARVPCLPCPSKRHFPSLSLRHKWLLPGTTFSTIARPSNPSLGLQGPHKGMEDPVAPGALMPAARGSTA